MKYSHVIYNSSEKNRSGGVGFGVRSATVGIQPQLLAAMEQKQNGIFSFNEANVTLSPSSLFENPDIIKQTDPSYFFQVVALPDQTKGYVIGRKIAVGFDYTFYLNGRPCRLGNYVVDSYVFPECPTAEAFEILLENPAPGSHRFIPADPAPREANEEMRRISIGHQPDLREEQASFRSAAGVEIGSKAIDLLFAFIQSRKVDKPLLVKAEPEEAPRLLAALASILPQSSIPDMTFVTNHNEQGVRAGINICFISRNYRHEIFPNLWVVLDLNAAQHPDTQEYAMFAPMVEQYLRAGELRKVRAIAAWCLSPTYEASKSASPATQKALFSFIHDFDAFDERLIASDEKLKELIISFLKQAPEEKQKLDRRLQERLDPIDHYADLKAWIDYVRNIRPIDMSAIIAKPENKDHINRLIFDDAKAFQSIYDSYSAVWPEFVRDYIDPEKFIKKSFYISNLDSKRWEKLYPYFLKEIIDRKDTLILRMFVDQVEAPVRKRIIDKEIPDKQKQAEVFVAILLGAPGEYDGELIHMLVGISSELGTCPIDFFKTFEMYIPSGKYSSLFACQLDLSKFKTADAIKEFLGRVKLFVADPKGADWLKGRPGHEAFASAFASLVALLKSGATSRDEAVKICETVRGLSVSPNIHEKFSLLKRVLQRSNFYDDNEVNDLWSLASELGDKEYMKMLLPDLLKIVERTEPNKLQNRSDLYPDGLVAYLIREGIVSQDDIMAIASKSERAKFYYIAILKLNDLRPQEEYDFLTQKAGLSDDEALGILDKFFPESYRKVMKSRQPSVWSKISGGLKGMFAKKDKSDDDPNDSSKGGQSGNPRPASFNPSQNRRPK